MDLIYLLSDIIIALPWESICIKGFDLIKKDISDLVFSSKSIGLLLVDSRLLFIVSPNLIIKSLPLSVKYLPSNIKKAMVLKSR